MEEVWKGLIYKGEDYSKFYDVSNLGKIRNCRTLRVIKPSRQTTKDYWGVALSLGSCEKQRRIKVHLAVACTFIPNPHNLPEVNHKDGSKEDNTEHNLEWCTRSYNTKHAVDMGLVPKRRKINIKLIVDIRDDFKNRKISISKLVIKYDRPYSTIADIVNYKSYKDLK